MKITKQKKTLSTSLIALMLLGGVISSKQVSACSIDPMLGSMCVFAGNFAPRGYALSHGQLLSVASNTALFSLLGTTYGGDGRTTFGLPDARGRALIGAGQGPGLSSYRLGQNGGLETVALSTAQMPSHTHSATTTVSGSATLNATANIGNSDVPTNNVAARLPRNDNYSSNVPDVTMSASAISLALNATTTVGNMGGSQGHENRMPYLVVNWIIALQGFYPSRN